MVPKIHPSQMTVEQRAAWEAKYSMDEKAQWVKDYPAIPEPNHGREAFDELLDKAAKPKSS